MKKSEQLPNGKAGFSHKTMLPMSHVDRRLFPPIFISNVGHNQSVSRIVTLTFPTKSMNDESAFLVQRAHPYRAFLRNHIRTKSTASATTGGSTQLLHPSRLALITTEQSPHLYCFNCFCENRRVDSTFTSLQTFSHHYRAVTSSVLLLLLLTPSRGSTILVLEPIEQSIYSLNYRAVTISLQSCQFILGTTEQSIIGSLYQLNIQAVLAQFEYSLPQDIFEDHLSTRTQSRSSDQSPSTQILLSTSNPFLRHLYLKQRRKLISVKSWEIYIL